jgi:hypothetical protein
VTDPIPGRAVQRHDDVVQLKGQPMMIRPIEAAEPVEPVSRKDVETIRFAELYGSTLDLSTVDLVIAPLIGLGFDSVELIESLSRAGFRGRLRVTARWLPDSDIVLAELRALADPVGISVSLHTGPRATWSLNRGPVARDS